MSSVTATRSGSGGTRRLLGRLPLHIVIIAVCLVWMEPALALLVSSFRPAAAVARTGWWTAEEMTFGPAN